VENPLKDPIIAGFKRLVLKVASRHGIKVLSIVLYGSRAQGFSTSKSDYDFLIILGGKVSLLKFTRLSGELRLLARRLDKEDKIKIYLNTLRNLQYLLKKDRFLGAFCYIIFTTGKPIYDPEKTFEKIKGKLENLPARRKEAFLKACVEASRKLGSKRWETFWKEKLKELKAYRGGLK